MDIWSEHNWEHWRTELRKKPDTAENTKKKTWIALQGASQPILITSLKASKGVHQFDLAEPKNWDSNDHLTLEN